MSTDNGHITIGGGLSCVSASTDDGHITIDSLEYGDIYTGDGHVDVTVAGPGAAVAVHADTVVDDPAC